MSKRTKWAAIAGSAFVTLLVIIVARSALTEGEFFVFLVSVLLLGSMLEALFLNRGGHAGGAELATRQRNAVAIVLEEIAPIGKVELGAEIWNARSVSGAKIAVGETVRVRKAEGLTLLVESAHDIEAAI